MPKHIFSATTYPLLAMLQRGACLDELLVEPPLPLPDDIQPIYDKIASGLAHTAENRNVIYSMSKRPPQEVQRILHEYNQQMCQYLQTGSTAIGWTKNLFTEYQQSEPEFTDFEAERFEHLFTSRNLTAYYIPPATQDAVEKAMPAIEKRFNEAITDFPTESGILLDSVFRRAGEDHTFIFDVSSQHITLLMVHTNLKQGHVSLFTACHYNVTTGQLGYIGCEEKYGKIAVTCLIERLIFIYFFQVEKLVAEAPPNSKYTRSVKAENGDQYDTSLAYPVNIIDATWFTTLIHTNPSLVKGHFRNQPYGPGRGQYKIVWIESHARIGYTRTAKTRKPQ